MAKRTPASQETIDAVGRDFRAGVLTAREIGAQYGVSHTMVLKWADRFGWVRDLRARIDARAEELVSRQVVSADVAKSRLETESVIVEANAQRIASIKSAHRSDVERVRKLVMQLIAELEAESESPEDLQKLGEMMADPDTPLDAMQNAFKKATSLPGRSTTAKQLVESFRQLVSLEREIYGMDRAKEEDKPERKAIEVDNKMAREIAYALHLGLKAANDSATKAALTA